MPSKYQSVFLICLLAQCLLLKAVLAQGPQAQLQPAQLLPESTLVQVGSDDLDEIIDTILEHPLRERLEALPVYQALLESEDMVKADFGLRMFSAAMGKPWKKAVKELASEGISLSLDSSEGVVLLARSADSELLTRLRDFIISLTGELGAEEKGEYRGFEAFALPDEWKMAVMDDWLLVTNQAELGKQVIDNYLDRPSAVLANLPKYQQAMAELTAAKSIHAFLDVETVRESGEAEELYRDLTNNFFEELLIGGLLNNIQNTPYATAELSLDDHNVRFQLQTPHQADWEAPREYFFGAPNRAVAPPLLEVKDRLFAVSTYRDISQMWLRAGDLMSDKANDELAQADTQLTTFFAGRDFGEDVLGAFKGDVQLVGKPQDFQGVPTPAIQLPSFAFQFSMKDPEQSQAELRRVFQSFIGFINVVGAMDGQPQFDQGTEQLGEATLHFALYVPEQGESDEDVAINYNFSPTIAFNGEYFILSSANSLARELVSTAEPSGRESGNTVVTVNAESLGQILAANKDQLIAQNMLEKGHDEKAAEGEIGLLLEAIQFFELAEIRLDIDDEQLRFSAEVQFND